jgi:hypothetical protein
MTPQDIERIRSSDGWRKHRTEIVETSQGRVVVKGQRPARIVDGHGLLNALASLAGAPLLRAVPAHGGAKGQAVEVRRLAALRDAGIRVPQVLHVDAEFFVMEFLDGPNLAQVLAEQPAKALGLWQQGLELVHGVHARGQYLSQANARNIIVTPQGLAAIDFEDDPLEVLTLEQAQVRNWLMYLQSTVWLMPEAHPRLLSIWELFAPSGSGLQADLLLKTVLQLGWMRHLPHRRRPWGRDIVSAQAAASFLHDWTRHARHP